jgi:hypothetical protein
LPLLANSKNFRAATKCSQFEVPLLANCKNFRYAAGQTPLHWSCFCWQIANLSLRDSRDFFKFATCCKLKGLFVAANLVGSLIGAYSDRHFHEPLQAPLWSVGQLFLNFEHAQARARENSPRRAFFVINIFWPNIGIFSECR